MRLLYVDIHLHALNPTQTLTPLLAQSAVADTSFFGPGFVSAETLKRGLAAFVDDTGPYDAVLIGPGTPLLDPDADSAANVAYLQRYTAMAPAPELLARYFQDALHAIPRLAIATKLISLLNFDYYATSQRQIDGLMERGLAVLAPNHQFVRRLDELPAYAGAERHFQRKKHRLSDAWFDFVSRYPEQVATAVHFVAETEFSFRHPTDRPTAVEVPGVEYLLRDKALKALAADGIKPGAKTVFHLYRLANRLKLPAFSRFLPLKLYNLAFQQGLFDTRTVYTARGGFGMPIRKFFEIPAAGALMVCTPPLGFADLGFRAGATHVECDPEELPTVIRRFEAAPEEIAAIAAAGRKLVFERHSLGARATQLRECLDAMVAGRYAGAQWIDGTFHVKVSS